MRFSVSLFLIGLYLLFFQGSVWSAHSGVNPEKYEELKTAAPLNHSVKISRAGRVLKLDYELIGVDGKSYNLWDIHDRSDPTFTIYRDGVVVGNGTFEFG